MMRDIGLGVMIAALAIAAGCTRAPEPAKEEPAAAPAAPMPVTLRGLDGMPVPVPPDNPVTEGKIKLGEQLFFDKRLSRTGAMSCETCHVPEKGWTDGLALSPKFDGSMNTRHSPTLIGVAYFPDLYWDGRAKGLDAQIVAAWRGQMGADPDAIAKNIEAVAGYTQAFTTEFGGPATGDRIVKALATFLRSIPINDTPWDREPKDPASLKKSEIGQGFLVFSETAKCTLCHLPPLFSDTLFHNVGIGSGAATPDVGRGKILSDAATKEGKPVTKEIEVQMGAFKTPSLRGVALSGPYFHDGSVQTLEEAVDLMLKGGIKNPNLDEKLQAWRVTPEQRKQLLAFLQSLTPDATTKPYPRPNLPS